MTTREEPIKVAQFRDYVAKHMDAHLYTNKDNGEGCYLWEVLAAYDALARERDALGDVSQEDAERFQCLAHMHTSRLAEAFCSAKHQLAAAERERDEWKRRYFHVADAVAERSESAEHLADIARATREEAFHNQQAWKMADAEIARLRTEADALRGVVEAARDYADMLTRYEYGDDVSSHNDDLIAAVRALDAGGAG